MKQKSEVAVIDFTKFDIQQLPELQGKKEEIKKVIKENPVVKVTDNASYELAKKSRTAVKTLRTSLEKEKKEVNDRIKKSVLEVVANEYDSLITSVRNDENARQEEVTAWETVKENERLEKLRLEQERVDSIKKSIGEFRQHWEDQVSHLTFEVIEDVSDLYSVAVVEFDRDALAEFDVLFTDSVNYIDKLLESRINTLTEQENIRIAQIELEKEKERQHLEAERIADEQRKEREKLEAEQKAEAEKIRLAKEAFEKEKREFEEKQAEAKFQERKKFLVDEDYWRIYLLAECGDNEDVAKGKLLNFNDGEFQGFKHAVIKAKTPINETGVVEEVKSEQSTKESVVVFEIDGDNLTAHEERLFESEPLATSSMKTVGERMAFGDYNEADVDPKGVIADGYATNETLEVEFEETWESIWNNWHINFRGMTFLDFLKERYNVPTQKDE